MTKLTALSIPFGSKWSNVDASRKTIEEPALTIDWVGGLTLCQVPARQGGISFSADLCVPEGCAAGFHAELMKMERQNLIPVFMFSNYLFELMGFGHNPLIYDVFQLNGVSLASLEDMISLLPYQK